MADDNFGKYRAREPYGRAGEVPAAGNDPLAELARLIGQTDQFSEFRRLSGAPPQQPRLPTTLARGAPPSQNYGTDPRATGHGYDAPSFAPPFGPASETYRGEFENPPAGQHAPPNYDANAYYQDPAGSAHRDDIYDDEPPVRRRISVLMIAGIFALAIIGTAGAFGYRALFGSSGSSPPPVIKADATPSKIVPATANASGKQITDRLGAPSERLVSREEQPIDLKEKAPQPVFPNPPSPSTTSSAPAAPGASAPGEPKKIRTIAIRPDQLGGTEAAPAPATPSRSAAGAAAKPAAAPRAAADVDTAAGPSPIRPTPTRQTASSPNAPLSLNPDADQPPAAPAPARAARAVAAAPAAAPGAAAYPSGSYLVQVSSQRSEADAQSAFRSLQGKFPTQLGSRQAVIRRADLGDKGTFYRAMVGPFANGSEASELCNSLKSAGGSCVIQRN